jgi:hypothetical protein
MTSCKHARGGRELRQWQRIMHTRPAPRAGNARRDQRASDAPQAKLGRPDSLNGAAPMKIDAPREARAGHQLHERAWATLPSMSHRLQQLRERDPDVDVSGRTAAQNVGAHGSSTVSAWRWSPARSTGAGGPFGGYAVVARACSVPRCGGRDRPLGLETASLEQREPVGL